MKLREPKVIFSILAVVMFMGAIILLGAGVAGDLYIVFVVIALASALISVITRDKRPIKLSPGRTMRIKSQILGTTTKFLHAAAEQQGETFTTLWVQYLVAIITCLNNEKGQLCEDDFLIIEAYAEKQINSMIIEFSDKTVNYASLMIYGYLEINKEIDAISLTISNNINTTLSDVYDSVKGGGAVER